MVGAYHRTLGTYVNELVAVGLRIEGVIEPGGGDRALPGPDTSKVPVFAFVRCKKV